MRLKRILLWVLIATPALCALLVWALFDGWLVTSRTPEAHANMLWPGVEVLRPAGEGPFPAVVLFHGCAGLWRGDIPRPIMKDYAEVAAQEGVVAIIVDSLSPRGIGYTDGLAYVCRGYMFRGRERASDVAVAFDIARRLGVVDPSRIALAGWSHGGWAVMDALSLDPSRQRPHGLSRWPERPFEGLRGVYLVYPYCGFPALVRNHGFARPVAVEAILVDRDGLADPAACEVAFDRIRAGGSQVDVTRFEGVTHAFDESDLEAGARLRFDPRASDQARDLFRGFLRRHITGGRSSVPAP